MFSPNSDASSEIFSCTVASGVRSSDGLLDGGGVVDCGMEDHCDATTNNAVG